jgi:hypothetical protein
MIAKIAETLARWMSVRAREMPDSLSHIKHDDILVRGAFQAAATQGATDCCIEFLETLEGACYTQQAKVCVNAMLLTVKRERESRDAHASL